MKEIVEDLLKHVQHFPGFMYKRHKDITSFIQRVSQNCYVLPIPGLSLTQLIYKLAYMVLGEVHGGQILSVPHCGIRPILQ